MTKRVDTIEGIGPVYRGKLEAVGIATVDDLIDRCGLPSRRQEVAAITGLRQQQLLKWVQIADLMRLQGVGKEYSQLLEAAGVHTLSALRSRDVEKLHTRIAEVNEFKKLARRTPGLHDVSAWVAAAQSLEQRVY